MFFKYNSYTIIWALFVALLSLSPKLGSAESYGGGFDKIVHIVLYCVFVLLAIVGFIKQHQIILLKTRPVLMAISIGITYGLIMECFQSLVPGRSFDVIDIVANGVGSIMGFGLFYLIYKI